MVLGAFYAGLYALMGGEDKPRNWRRIIKITALACAGLLVFRRLFGLVLHAQEQERHENSKSLSPSSNNHNNRTESRKNNVSKPPEYEKEKARAIPKNLRGKRKGSIPPTWREVREST